jgi:DNA repair exonuclease SbcCD ATPase subunit
LVRYKNFLSTGNVFTEITLDSHKTTLVVGKNGAGKSTMLDAISYALFARPFRNIRKPQLKNSINKKELLVELEFTIGSSYYRVVRGQIPNVFEIWHNGVMLNQDAANRDYQEVLEKQILKLNYKTFRQVVVLGSTSFVPFMDLPTGARREIIEDILDLQVFSMMNNILKERAGSNVSSVKELTYELKLIEQKIELQKKHVDAMVRDAESLISVLNDKIKSALESITEHDVKVRANSAKRDELLESVQDDPSRVRNRLAKLNALSSQITSKIDSVREDIKFYEDNDVCPTCHQDISHDFKHEHVHSKEQVLRETREGLDKLEDEINLTKEKLKFVVEVHDACSQINLENTVALSTIQSLENQIRQHQREIRELQDKKSSFHGDENDVKKLEREKKSLEKKKSKLLGEKDLYGAAAIMLKDSGIKAKIIKKYVPLINKYINKYLTAMDFFVSFELDENFNETIKSRHRDDFSYTSFSEGEKSRINLAMLFTWRSIAKLRNSASTNLLIFDEIFDGSLDGDGTEEFMKILSLAAPEANVIVISHKTDAMLDRFDRAIKFEKVKNFSQISSD